MARLRILELPVVHRGDDMETPFIIVFDRTSDQEATFGAGLWWQMLKEDTGAACCIQYPGELELE